VASFFVSRGMGQSPGEESLATAIAAQAIEAEPSFGQINPIETECVNAGPKGSCERPRGFSHGKMKAARSPFFEAGGKRSRALARAQGALAAHPQERQHSAAEGGRRDRVRRTGVLRECVATGVDGGNIR
jgi:hypothetical protein